MAPGCTAERGRPLGAANPLSCRRQAPQRKCGAAASPESNRFRLGDVGRGPYAEKAYLPGGLLRWTPLVALEPTRAAVLALDHAFTEYLVPRTLGCRLETSRISLLEIFVCRPRHRGAPWGGR